jgi:hypothetical protein
MDVEFHPEPLAEFKVEVIYYKEVERGLGGNLPTRFWHDWSSAPLSQHRLARRRTPAQFVGEAVSVSGLLRSHRRETLDLGGDARGAPARRLEMAEETLRIRGVGRLCEAAKFDSIADP